MHSCSFCIPPCTPVNCNHPSASHYPRQYSTPTFSVIYVCAMLLHPPHSYLPIMHERRNDRPSRYILVHLQWGEVTVSLTLSRMKNKVKVLYFSLQSSLPLEWHCVEISDTGFHPNRSRNMESTGRNSFTFLCTV